MKAKTGFRVITVVLVVMVFVLFVSTIRQAHQIDELIWCAAEQVSITKAQNKIIKDFYKEQGEFNARDWGALDRIIPWLEEHHEEFKTYRINKD